MSREVTEKAEVARETAPVRGATPTGASDRDSAARAVREMFTAIAPRYDLLNHLLSANVDKLWWRRTARSFANVLAQPGVQVLDLCCGTGDMALALRRQGPQAEITGADFSHTMLVLASRKKSASHAPFNGSKLTRCNFLFPTRASTWSLLLSASAISLITTPVCAKFSACCGPAANAAFWNSVSRKG